jgi:outer membrane protein assembly factor BamB
MPGQPSRRRTDPITCSRRSVLLGGSLGLAAAQLVLGPAPAALAEPTAQEARWQLVWRATLPEPVWAPLAAAGDVLLAFLRNGIVARTLARGQPLWERALDLSPTLGCACLAPPTQVADAVYAVAEGNRLEALDVRTGARRWARPIGEIIISRPVADGRGMALVVAIEGMRTLLTVLDTRTGRLRWQREVPDPAVTEPLVLQDVIYLLDGRGVLTAYTAADGRPRWEAGGLAPGETLTAAQVGRETVVLRSEQGLLALDLASGEPHWAVPREDLPGTPIVAGDVAVTATLGRRILGLDLATGGVRWEQSNDAAILETPQALGDLVLLSDINGVVFALGQGDGTLRWQARLGWVRPPLTALDGRLYAIAAEGRAYVLDLSRGEIVTMAPFPGPVPLGGLVVDGTVFAAVDERQGSTIYALRPPL